MTLREQLMLKRTLRRLRTWAPPISMGVIIGAGALLIADRLDPPRETAPAAVTTHVQQQQPVRRSASTARREAQPVLLQASQPSRSYSDCDAARAAGAAPVYAGEPGYGPHLDADRDGVGCEPYAR